MRHQTLIDYTISEMTNILLSLWNPGLVSVINDLGLKQEIACLTKISSCDEIVRLGEYYNMKIMTAHLHLLSRVL